MARGDHIYVRRYGGTYAHHGIDAGDGTDGVAVKHRAREIDVGHGEIADRGAERRLGYRHADHQAECEQ